MKKILLIITMLVVSTSIFAQLDSSKFNRLGMSYRWPYGWFDKDIYIGSWGNKGLSYKDTTNTILTQMRANAQFVKKTGDTITGSLLSNEYNFNNIVDRIFFLFKSQTGIQNSLLSYHDSATGWLYNCLKNNQLRLTAGSKATNGLLFYTEGAPFAWGVAGSYAMSYNLSNLNAVGANGSTFAISSFSNFIASNIIGGGLNPNGGATSYGTLNLHGGAGIGTNQIGYNLIFNGGRSTGNAANGSVIIRTGQAGGGSGATLNPLVDRMVFSGTSNDVSFLGNFTPTTNNTYSVGSSSYRWSNIYSTLLSVSGLASGASTDSVVTVDASGNFKKRSSSFYSGGSSLTTASGDASGTVSGSNLPLTLATVNSNVGTYGGATNIPIITANAKGLVTALATTSIPVLATGTYTPTLSSLANCTSATASVAQWMQLGNVVTVSGSIQLTPANTTSVFLLYMSIPVVANFLAASSKAGGVASRSNGNTSIACIGAINADSAGSQNVIVTFSKAEAATADTYYYTYTYRTN